MAEVLTDTVMGVAALPLLEAEVGVQVGVQVVMDIQIRHSDPTVALADLLAIPVEVLVAPGVAPVGIAYTGNSIFNVPASALRCPAISLPLMQVGGLPLGVQLLGQPLGERTLSGVARYVASLNTIANG